MNIIAKARLLRFMHMSAVKIVLLAHSSATCIRPYEGDMKFDLTDYSKVFSYISSSLCLTLEGVMGCRGSGDFYACLLYTSDAADE